MMSVMQANQWSIAPMIAMCAVMGIAEEMKTPLRAARIAAIVAIGPVVMVSRMQIAPLIAMSVEMDCAALMKALPPALIARIAGMALLVISLNGAMTRRITTVVLIIVGTGLFQAIAGMDSAVSSS